MVKKRGQAALEFLMTYGWAILVVLVVIGTLAYFGVLNPSFLLPEKCTLQLGLYCKDHRIDAVDKSVRLMLQNGIGQGIIITRLRVADEKGIIMCDSGVGKFTSELTKPTCNGVDCSGCGNLDPASLFTAPDDSYVGCNPLANYRKTFNGMPGWHLENTYDSTIKIPCDKMSQAEGKAKVRMDVVYFYDDSTADFEHTMQGELLAKLEKPLV